MSKKVDKVISGLAILAGTAQVVGSVIKKTFGKFDELGQELVDGRAMEPPLGHVPTVPLAEQIAQAVRAEAFKRAMEESGSETFEEAEDFDVGEDFDPTSPYEAYFEPITESQVESLERQGFVVRKVAPPAPEPPAAPAAPAAPAQSGPGSQPVPPVAAGKAAV